MESVWLAAYLVLVLLAIVQAFVLGLQTWEHRRYARSCLRRLDRHHPTGHAVLFAPCKGLDVGLEGNLHALFHQDYDDYELVFIVESEEDPACETIQRVMAGHPSVPSRLVIADHATDTGQKTHNLRVATADLSPEVEYLAFVDSDAGPRPEWLRLLMSVLQQRRWGAVTGYRWFMPVRGSFSNHLLYSMNCDVMALLGCSSHYLIWGGSWGIRRDVFDSIGLRDAWEGTLSDDLIASRTLQRARLPVRFEPACVVGSPLDYSPREMFSFIRRQYLVARFYTPRWWVFALAVATFSNLVWIGNLAALAAGLVCGTPPVWLVLCASLGLYLLAAMRRASRQDLVRTYFPERLGKLRAARRFDIWAGPIVGLVNWLGIIASLFGRHICWRGIRYEIAAGGKVRAIHREDHQRTQAPGDGDLPLSSDVAGPNAPTPQLTRYRKAC